MNTNTLYPEAASDFAADVAKRKASIKAPHMTSVDLPLQVEYFHTPAEKRTHNHPGIDESVEIVTVRMWGITASGKRVLMEVRLPREVERAIAQEVLHG